MDQKMIELLICRHASVPFSYNEDGSRNIVALDITLDVSGYIEMWSIGERYAATIKLADALTDELPSVAFICSSPSIRSMLSASQFATKVHSQYKYVEQLQKNSYAANREWVKKKLYGIDPLQIQYPLSLAIERKLLVIQEELNVELMVRKWGITIDDHLKDILAPPEKFIGYPIHLYHENIKDAMIEKPDLISLNTYCKSILKKLQSLQLENTAQQITRGIIFTHGHTAKALLSLFSEQDIDKVSSYTIRDFDHKFPFPRGTAYVLRFTSAGQLCSLMPIQ